MAVKRGINIRKGRRQTKHGLPIGSADRAAQDLTLSRYKEPAEPLEGRGRRLPPGRSCGGAWLSDRSAVGGATHIPRLFQDAGLPKRESSKTTCLRRCAGAREPTDSRAFR
jgi:hypothetical protein